MSEDIVTAGVGDVQLVPGGWGKSRNATKQSTIRGTTTKNELHDPTETAFDPGH